MNKHLNVNTRVSFCDGMPLGISARYFSLGRYALLAGLNLLRLPPDSNVLVPAFICRDLLAAIHAAEAVPVFYAVDMGLKPRDSYRKWPKAAAVIAVNYFGFPQDLSEFHLYCEKNKAFLIEDNAHGFLSMDEQEIPLGTRGDIGLLSMRKTLLIPDGAALLVSRENLIERIPFQLPFESRGLSMSFWAKMALIKLQSITGIPVLAWMKSTVRIFRKNLNGHPIKPAQEDCEFKLPGQPSPHRYLLKALKYVNQVAESNNRRSLYETWKMQLSSRSIQPVFDILPPYTVPYGYPFYASEEEAAKVRKLAHAAGCDCIKWPDLPQATDNPPLPHYHKLWFINFSN